MRRVNTYTDEQKEGTHVGRGVALRTQMLVQEVQLQANAPSVSNLRPVD